MAALNKPCLVLNKSWLPIGACTVRNALRLLVVDKVVIVDAETYETHSLENWLELPCINGDPSIITTHGKVKRPEVVRLKDFNRTPKRNVNFSKRNTYLRDNFYCQFCGKPLSMSEATIDHLMPRSRGGETSFYNCVTSCYPCNNKKDNRTAEQAGMKLRRMIKKDGELVPEFYSRPTKPVWLPSFLSKFGRCPDSWDKFIKRA